MVLIADSYYFLLNAFLSLNWQQWALSLSHSAFAWTRNWRFLQLTQFYFHWGFTISDVAMALSRSELKAREAASIDCWWDWHIIAWLAVSVIREPWLSACRLCCLKWFVVLVRSDSWMILWCLICLKEILIIILTS